MIAHVLFYNSKRDEPLAPPTGTMKKIIPVLLAAHCWRPAP